MKYQKTILKNGIRLITVPLKGNMTTTVSIMANVGARYEEEKNNGISHFLEHLQFKGTKTKSSKDIVLELDEIGAEYNAFTNYEVTGYWAKTNNKNFKKVLDIVTDIYKNSIFPENEIEKERGVILEEINMYEDNNKMKAYMNFRTLMYGDHPLGREVLGPKENIKKLQREDFLTYRDKHYKGKATTVVVAGDIKTSEIKKMIEDALGDLDAGKFYNPEKINIKQKNKQVKILNKKTDQTHMILGFRTFGIKDKNLATARLLSGVLSAGMSSRLFSKMREELGICYYCYASNNYTFDTGYMGIFAGVGNKRVGEAVTGILEILEDIKTNGVPKKELDKVKNIIYNSTDMNLETSDQWADYYGDQEVSILDIKTPAQIKKEIKAVTSEDVQKLAKKIFTENNMNLAILGPHNDPKQFEKLLK
jgi:predicted Zn-dependent peptidase